MQNIDTIPTAAKDLETGNTVLVNLGRGSSPRIIDSVTPCPETKSVEIVLYAESGRRPRIVLSETQTMELITAGELAKAYGD